MRIGQENLRSRTSVIQCATLDEAIELSDVKYGLSSAIYAGVNQSFTRCGLTPESATSIGDPRAEVICVRAQKETGTDTAEAGTQVGNFRNGNLLH